VIKAQKITFSYTGLSPYTIDNLDFEIEDGAYVSVLGDNGSGKTTLMRLILKFLKPVSGSITCTAKRIGYVPQRNQNTNESFPITVFEVMNSYRKILKLRSKEEIYEKLELVGMRGFENNLINNLSGGQSQRVMIARALMGNPELLILDEPSTGVDIGNQKEVYSVLRRINQENGITIVSVEHNLDAAISNSTLIYHLINGKGHLCSPDKYANEYLKTKGRVQLNV
jgi:zinc transport system ATP-binding protein